MNTPASPRDLLLARHAAARPALDGQADALLARFTASSSSDVTGFSLRGVLEALWRELFVPCRGAWATLACLWVAILAFDRLNTAAAAPERATEIAHSDAAWLAVWLQQRRLLAEFVCDSFSPVAPPPAETSAPVVPPLGFIDSVSNPARYV